MPRLLASAVRLNLCETEIHASFSVALQTANARAPMCGLCLVMMAKHSITRLGTLCGFRHPRGLGSYPLWIRALLC
jgi:hypothetical protein